jgi:CBS domain-containing protein
MTIARLIQGRTGSIHSCTTATPVHDAIGLLAEKRIGAVPVFDGGRLAGIFSERDVIYGLNNEGASFLDHTVGEVMTAPAVTVSPETTVLEALALITRHRFRHLPVERGGEIVAFISIGDLVKHRIDLIQSEAEALRSYIQTA